VVYAIVATPRAHQGICYSSYSMHAPSCMQSEDKLKLLLCSTFYQCFLKTKCAFVWSMLKRAKKPFLTLVTLGGTLENTQNKKERIFISSRRRWSDLRSVNGNNNSRKDDNDDFGDSSVERDWMVNMVVTSRTVIYIISIGVDESIHDQDDRCCDGSQ